MAERRKFGSTGGVSSSEANTRLTVVIVNYRTADLVIQCLDSVLEDLKNIDSRVVVVDNCSLDGSAATLQRWTIDNGRQDIVQIIPAQFNGGFSAGNNIGIRALRAEYYLLLNSDTIVRSGAIIALLRAGDEHPEAGLISPRLEWPDATPQQSCFRDMSPISQFIDAARTGPVTAALRRFDVPLPVSDVTIRPNWTSFACVLVRGQVFDDIGFMDEGFFMYFEDAEFCRRARHAGWQILHDPAARVVHLRGGSSPVKKMALERKRLPRYYYASRTRYLYLAYGRVGLTLANVLWSAGRCLSKCREFLGRSPSVPEGQWRDIWVNWLDPGVPWSQQQKESEVR